MKEKRRAEENAEDHDTVEEQEIVNVDFDFFDITDIDFHAVKNLLRQLLDSDNISFELSPLAEEIVSAKAPGISVKTDGKDSDPYAFLTVVDGSGSHAASAPYLQPFASYFIEKSNNSPEFNRKLRKLFMTSGSESASESLGIVFSERVINMPVEVVPPMYKLLFDELESNTIQSNYDLFLLVSKVFTEQQPTIDAQQQTQSAGSRPAKKLKPGVDADAQGSGQIYYFHPEDELLHKYATYHTVFEYTNPAQTSDSKRAFQDYGIFPKGHIMLFTREKLLAAIQEMLTALSPGVM